MKRLLKSYLSGRALYFTIFISLVVAILLSLFIARNQLYQIEKMRLQQHSRLQDNINSALSLCLTDSELNSKIDLYQNEEDLVDVSRQAWGGYEVLKVNASWKQLKQEAVFLTGDLLFQDERSGLYLADKGKYLSIAGKTYLSGSVYLPKLGIRSVYIEGESYKNSKLVFGESKTSKPELPELNSVFVQHAENLLGGRRLPNDSLLSEKDFYRKKSISQAYANKTLSFHSTEAVELAGIELQGNIHLHSGKSVRITSSADLMGVLISAPKIIVEKGFRGQAQLFASDTLVVEEDVELQYPSLVLVHSIANSAPLCRISEDASLAGGVLVTASGQATGTGLYVEPGATIHGLVYCNASIDHRGSIIGSLYCNLFRMQTNRGLYENHLLGAVVNPENLPNDFTVPKFLQSATKSNVVQCLN